MEERTGGNGGSGRPFRRGFDPRRHPGRQHGVKNKPRFSDLEQNIVEAIAIPISTFLDPDVQPVVQEKLKAALLKNPPGYLVKIVIPIAKLLPQPVLIQIFANLGLSSESNPLDAIMQARDALIELQQRKAISSGTEAKEP